MDVDRKLLESIFVSGSSKTNYSKILDIQVEPGVGKGENDGSVMLRVKVNFEINPGQNETLYLMYKKKRNEISSQDLTEQIGLFKIETMMYGNYLKKMLELNQRLGDNENLSPKCYGFGEDIILMEDLKQIGFKMIKASDGMDIDHANVSIRCLARFHALSMKLIDDGTLDSNSLQPWWFHRNLPVIDNMMKGGINTLADVIEQDWNPGWENAVVRLREAAKDVGLKLQNLSEETKGTHLEVLNHGDCWSNNLMFKYNNDNSLQSMRFVDFQVCHFNSLCWDLTYLIYNCVFPDKRRKWYDSLIDLYSETLSSLCTLYGYQGTIPSRDDIQQAMNKILYFGFLNSINNVPIFIAMALPDFEFDMDQLASSNPDETPVSHQSRYYRSQRVTELMKGDLEYFMSLNVL